MTGRRFSRETVLDLVSDTGSILFSRLDDPVINVVGYAPSDPYVERYWLPQLGPGSFVLMRRLDPALWTLSGAPASSWSVSMSILAADVGLAYGGGRDSALVRTLTRMGKFGWLAQRPSETGSASLGVRTMIPPLTERQIDRLPPWRQAACRAERITRERAR